MQVDPRMTDKGQQHMTAKQTPGQRPQGTASPTPADPPAEDPTSTASERVPLTRQRVLATALRLVDAEGLDALTRRRLARELGRDVMTLYRYAPDQAALLDGIVELVLDELELPDESQDWQTQLRRSAHSFRRLALAHPHVVNLLLTRPVATAYGLRPPATLRPLEHFLELLTTAGFPAADAMRIHRAFVGFLYGHLLAELQDTIVNPDETDDLLRLGLHQLPPGSSRSCGASPATSPTTTAPASSTTVSTSSSPASPPPTAGHTRAATNLQPTRRIPTATKAPRFQSCMPGTSSIERTNGSPGSGDERWRRIEQAQGARDSTPPPTPVPVLLT